MKDKIPNIQALIVAWVLSVGAPATAALPVSKAVINDAMTASSSSIVVNALNDELGGTLTAEEIAAIESVEAQQSEQVQLQNVGLTVDGQSISLLVCVSGKAAAVIKGRVGVCSSLGGDVYNLLGYGGGASIGAQMSVFGVAVLSPVGRSIEGTYGAATTVAQGGLGYVVKGMFSAQAWRVQLHGLLRFLLAFGGPEFAVAHSQDSVFIMGGIGIGPMFDVGVEWFRLIQKS